MVMENVTLVMNGLIQKEWQIYFIVVIVKIYLLERQRYSERGRDRDLSSMGS